MLTTCWKWDLQLDQISQETVFIQSNQTFHSAWKPQARVKSVSLIQPMSVKRMRQMNICWHKRILDITLPLPVFSFEHWFCFSESFSESWQATESMTCMAKLDWDRGVQSPQKWNRAPFSPQSLLTRLPTRWEVHSAALTCNSAGVSGFPCWPNKSLLLTQKASGRGTYSGSLTTKPFGLNVPQLSNWKGSLCSPCCTHTKYAWNPSHTAQCPANIGILSAFPTFLQKQGKGLATLIVVWQLLPCFSRTNGVLGKSTGWWCYSLPCSVRQWCYSLKFCNV